MKYLSVVESGLLFFLFIFACEKKEAQFPTNYTADDFLARSKKQSKARLTQEIEGFKAYAKQRQKAFTSTPLGVFICKENAVVSTKKKSLTDTLSYTYSVEDTEGNILYTTEEIGLQKKVLGKSRILQGIEYGLKEMYPATQATLLLPSSLAYGTLGDRKKIQPNQPLVIQLTVNEK